MAAHEMEAPPRPNAHSPNSQNKRKNTRSPILIQRIEQFKLQEVSAHCNELIYNSKSVLIISSCYDGLILIGGAR